MSQHGSNYKACDHCYKQKKRCDGSLPCSNCQRLRRECDYTGKNRPRQRVEITRSSTTSSPLHTGSGHDSSASNPFDVLADSLGGAKSIGSFGLESLHLESSNNLQLEAEDRFFLIPNFCLTIEQFRESPELVKLTVCSLVAREQHYQGDIAHRTLYDYARQELRSMLDDEASIYVHTVKILTAMILLCYYEFSNELFYRSWVTVGTLTRLAVIDRLQRLDLKEGSPWKTRSAAELDAGRVTFWNCFLMDRIASWTAGASPGFAVQEIRTYLCDATGSSTGYHLTDEWRGADLPIFAYIMIAAQLWEQNDALFRVCFQADQGTLSGSDVRKKFAIQLNHIYALRDQSLRSMVLKDLDIFGNILLQLIVQSSLLQLCEKAVENDLPLREELKAAAFRTFLQLGNIHAEIGIYNAILTHTLFKAGLALIKLSAWTKTEPHDNDSQILIELKQGLTIIVTMLENLSATDPGAKNFVMQLQAGMNGSTMSQSVSELVLSSEQISAKQIEGIHENSLVSEDTSSLQKMFNQTTDRDMPDMTFHDMFRS